MSVSSERLSSIQQEDEKPFKMKYCRKLDRTIKNLLSGHSVKCYLVFFHWLYPNGSPYEIAR